MRIYPAILAAFCLLKGSSFLSADISVAVGERTGAAGETLTVPIDVQSDRFLTGLQLDLSFPSELVEILGVNKGFSNTDHVLMSNAIGNGARRMLLYSPTNTRLPDSVLANIEVRLGNNFPTGGEAFGLSSLRFVEDSGEVLNVALSPFVRLTSPQSGGILSERTPLSLSSIALETDGEVTRVEFFLGERRIGIDTTAPYTLAWQMDGSGDVVLYAVAFDEDGDSMASPAVELVSEGWAFIQPWREANFTTEQLNDPAVNGLFADPEGDTIVNFLEFAFGMDPWIDDSTLAPSVQVQEANGASWLSLQYRRLTESASVNYLIETSGNLIHWTPVGPGVSENLISESGGIQTLLLEQIAPVSGDSASASNYVRVRVEVTE